MKALQQFGNAVEELARVLEMERQNSRTVKIELEMAVRGDMPDERVLEAVQARLKSDDEASLITCKEAKLMPGSEGWVPGIYP